MKAKSYKMVAYSCPSLVEQEVRNYIQKGWKPYGSPMLMADRGEGEKIVQAMVLPGNPEDDLADAPIDRRRRVSRADFTQAD